MKTAIKPLDEYALSLFGWLCEAIHDHRKVHKGAYPRKIEMHPCVYKKLLMEVAAWRYAPNSTDIESRNFSGVPIIINEQATRLKIITVDNKVEYL